MPLNKTEQNIGAIISLLAIVLLSVYMLLILVGFGNELLSLSLLSAIVIGAITLRTIVLRKYRKENNLLVIDYLNVGIQRHLLGLFMIFYGIPKLLGNFFDYQLFALDSKLMDASEFELAWYYFGKNRWQELFAGIMEFVPGLLLFNRKTYYIAALILVPVTAQVFILNLFFKIGGITFPAATILLACNIYIIYSQKEKIGRFFKSLELTTDLNLSGKALSVIKFSKWTAIALAVLLIITKTRNVIFKPDELLKYEALVGVYTLDKMKKNNAAYQPAADSLYYKDLYIEKQGRWNILRRFNGRTDAYIMKLGTKDDSIKIYINKGGVGDDADVIDYSTALKGTYKLENGLFTINGVQLKDTLQLTYRKRDVEPKKWFW
ncbi:MAG: hypothetical protein ACXVP0_05650 [Bacteroidia bacterium]